MKIQSGGLFVMIAFAVFGCAPGESDLTNNRRPNTNNALIDYFDSYVTPKFRAKGCDSCHNPAVAGTVIFDYDALREMLLKGPTRTDNELVRKVAGFYVQPSGVHPGGDQCGYLGGEPCATISRWWDKESVALTPTPGGSGSTTPDLVGGISVNGQTGLIQGYAFDRNGVIPSVTVELYMNGPAGTGTLLSTQVANQSRSSPPFSSGFSYQPVAATYVDARPRKLYGYIVNGATKTLINGAPYDFIAGADASGMTYFQNNVVPLLGQCNQCHGSSWNDYFYTRGRLATPSPLDGGNATNNRLFTKASGIAHGGGSRCNGNQLCNMLQGWYATDFGN